MLHKRLLIPLSSHFLLSMARGMFHSRYSRRSYRRRPYVPRPVRSYVRRAIASNIENKRAGYDLSVVFNSVGATWVELNLTRITQGTDLFARIGRRVNVRSIEIKGAIAQGAAGGAFDDPYNVMRIILGLWTGLASANSAPLGTSNLNINSPISPWNASGAVATYRMQRKYLDRYITFSSPSRADETSLVPATRTFRYFKLFKRPMFIQYSDGTGDSADRFFTLSMISDSTAVPNPGFISGYVVLTYEDA